LGIDVGRATERAASDCPEPGQGRVLANEHHIGVGIGMVERDFFRRKTEPCHPFEPAPDPIAVPDIAALKLGQGNMPAVDTIKYRRNLHPPLSW